LSFALKYIRKDEGGTLPGDHKVEVPQGKC
jgi:hypothetical protein